MPKRYVRKSELTHKPLILNTDDNPHIITEMDRCNMNKLFQLVNSNRNCFFSMLNKPEYSKISDWAKSKVLALMSQNAFVPSWGTICNWLFSGRTDFPVCPICGKTYGDTGNISVRIGYSAHCSNRCKTLDPSVQGKISDTCMEKYGCGWTSQSETAKRSYAETCRERYGVDNTFQLESSKKKAKKTCLDRYGNENYRNDETRVATCMEKYGQGVNGKAISETLRKLTPEEKAEWTASVKRTKLEKYGDENWNNHGKAVETCLSVYGVPYPVQSDEIKHRVRETFLAKYGYDHDWKVPEIREKMRMQHLEKYGVEYPAQREDVKDARKQSNVRKFGTACSPSWNYRYDGHSFDSSWELAYYIWLKDNNINFIYPCDIRYEYVDSYGKRHTYNPDFRVGETVIEIKGGQFLDDSGKLMLPYRGHETDEEYAHLIAINDAKYRCMVENGVTIYTNTDIEKYLDYVFKKYGKNYLRQFGKPRRRKYGKT